MLDVQQMRVLSALAEQRSFTRAAESLGLTQSGVSHQVKRLSQQLGVTLIRPGRGVVFTPAGERLVALAQQILALLGTVRNAVEGGPTELGEVEPGLLRIGCPASVAASVLPEALREFRECLPRTAVTLKIGDTPAVLEGIRTGRLDLGVMLSPEKPDREISLTPMGWDRLSMVVHPQHPWALVGRVDRRGLSRELFILYDTASLTGRMTLKWLARFGVVPENCQEVGSMEAIKQLVRLGMGTSLLADWVCREELTAGMLVSLPVDRPRLIRRWVVGRDRRRPSRFAEELLTGLCVAAARLRMVAPETDRGA